MKYDDIYKLSTKFSPPEIDLRKARILDDYGDESYAKLIVNHKKPDDFVLGTGESHSVQEFIECAFNYVGLNWEDHIKLDPQYIRPSEVDHLLSDPEKARKDLKWSTRIKFTDLVKIMVDYDMKMEGLNPISEGIDLLERRNYSWIRY